MSDASKPPTALRRARAAPRPGLLLAWAPAGVTEHDRRAVGLFLEIGRATDGWSLDDEQLSGRHLVVRCSASGMTVEDLDSTNGTFLDGVPLAGERPLEPGSLLRAGRCLFLAHPDLAVLGPGPHGRARPPLAPDVFVEALRRAAAARAPASAVIEAALGADHFEALCLAERFGTLDSWVRPSIADLEGPALEVFAAHVVTRWIEVGGDAEAALRDSFAERFGASPVATRAAPGPKTPEALYEAHRDKIVASYWASASDVAETERVLREEGIDVDRRWLAEYLELWGVR